MAAFLLTYINEGGNGTKELLKRGLDFRFRKIWFVPIFLLMPAIVGFSLLLAVLSGEPVPEIAVLPPAMGYYPCIFLHPLFRRPFAGRIQVERLCS